MLRQDFFNIQNWFFEYVNGFTSDDPNVQQNFTLKIDHTLRVCDNIKTISRELSFTSEQLPVAETAALLHDIGRFEQYSKYRTFLDGKSVNHAQLGLEIISRYNVLNTVEPQEKKLILDAVAWHNLAYLPGEEAEQSLILAKMLRDADKLDIWKVVTEYFNVKSVIKNDAIEFSLPDTPGFSAQVYTDLLNGGIVKTTHLQNLNDFKLLLVGCVFDLNYSISLQLLRERMYLESIRDVLPKNKEINNIFDHVNNYINIKLGIKK
jgi:putative nucleotidyltransferase with HDIG domain